MDRIDRRVGPFGLACTFVAWVGLIALVHHAHAVTRADLIPLLGPSAATTATAAVDSEPWMLQCFRMLRRGEAMIGRPDRALPTPAPVAQDPRPAPSLVQDGTILLSSPGVGIPGSH